MAFGFGGKDEEEDEDNITSKKKKGKNILGKILANKMLVIGITIFVLGIVLGAYAQHTYIEPILTDNTPEVLDYNSLLAQNQALDTTADNYYKCLIDSGISPRTC